MQHLANHPAHAKHSTAAALRDVEHSSEHACTALTAGSPTARISKSTAEFTAKGAAANTAAASGNCCRAPPTATRRAIAPQSLWRGRPRRRMRAVWYWPRAAPPRAPPAPPQSPCPAAAALRHLPARHLTAARGTAAAVAAAAAPVAAGLRWRTQRVQHWLRMRAKPSVSRFPLLATGHKHFKGDQKPLAAGWRRRGWQVCQ